MSTSSGHRSRPQAHQNTYAFRHNKNSTKTKKIAATAHVDDLCQRCAAKIEWRKKYRKYKPLTQPRRCNGCHEKKVKRAYRTLCQDCASERQCCPQCAKTLKEDVQEQDAQVGNDDGQCVYELMKEEKDEGQQ